MALSQSALSELLEALRAGDGVDLIRESVRTVMQELIEAEATEVIGAGRYERTASRTTERNGHRPRLLTTKAGDVQLAIPKLRTGSFFPSILEPRRRIDQALYAVVMEAYVQGRVDPRRGRPGRRHGRHRGVQVGGVADLRRPRRGGRRVPYPHAWTTRPSRTSSSTRPTCTCAATPLSVVSKAVVIATGVTAAGRREILGLDVGDSEDEVFWRGFLTALKKRGLAGVQLVISDQHAGLVAALDRAFQGVAHQRCRVHFIRNLLAHVTFPQVRGYPSMVGDTGFEPVGPLPCVRPSTPPVVKQLVKQRHSPPSPRLALAPNVEHLVPLLEAIRATCTAETQAPLVPATL